MTISGGVIAMTVSLLVAGVFLGMVAWISALETRIIVLEAIIESNRMPVPKRTGKIIPWRPRKK